MSIQEVGALSTEVDTTILIVEDTPEQLELVAGLLSKVGYHVVTAGGGREALEVALRERPHLILSDVVMPEGDGVELCRAVRADVHLQSTPIILASALQTDNESVIEGLQAGADDYLEVPYEPALLTTKVARLLERARTNEALRESEERFRLLVEGVKDYAIFMLDLEGHIISWNEGVKRVLGYSEQEITGRHFSCIFTPDDIKEGKPEQELETARRDGRADDERWHVREDGTPFWANGTVTALRDDEGALRGFAKVMRDVTVRKQLEDERGILLRKEQEARAEAEEANRLKDEFLATLSHELRTPLTSVLGWARLLRSDSLGDEDKERAIEAIERNAQAQKQLIDDILDVSRIVTGKFRLEIQPITLVPVIEAAVDAVRPAAEAKNIRLQVHAASQTGLVSGDADRLRQVVWNLLSNAIKFTPEGGRVEVRLERVDSTIRILVTDTGRGINPEFLPFVFERFRQADASTSRQYTGLGLGLAIVRHLVEMHGGQVQAESLGEGQGATFSVTLPLADNYSKDKGESNEAHALPKNPTASGTPVLEGLRVLVVDDDPDTLEYLSAVLTHCGATIMKARSAAEGFQLFQKSEPEILLSDIGMPGQDGYALIRKIRRLPKKRGGRVPAIAVTAYAREQDRMEAFRAGYQMHMTKPVEPDELIAVIASFSGRTADPERDE